MAAHPEVLRVFWTRFDDLALNMSRTFWFALLPESVFRGARANADSALAEPVLARVSHHRVSPLLLCRIAPSPIPSQPKTYVFAALYVLADATGVG
ncbi:MAG: hypothetical protein WA857_21680 [Candidatus Acidiferrum sp.]